MALSVPTTASAAAHLASLLALATLALLASTILVLIPTFTFLLGLIASIRRRLGSSRCYPPWSSYRTALYSGRVSHARYRPAKHAFSYPLFFCVLDLDEVPTLFGGGCEGGKNDGGGDRRGALWPLSLLMQFRSSDHLKNGEGMMRPTTEPGKKEEEGEEASAPTPDNGMRARISRLVSDRTEGKCRISADQRIVLITHLSYYGYCFNPVSFYYVLKATEGGAVRSEEERNRGDTCNAAGRPAKQNAEMIDGVVAEVSNTPWNEMRCYVLHPDSVDVDVVKPGGVRPRGEASKPVVVEFPRADDEDDDDNHDVDDTSGSGGSGGAKVGDWASVNYVFKKAFHVSPFMSMDHTYDWTFWAPLHDRINVSTTMIHIESGMPYFNAYFDVRRQTFTPLQLCYQLVRMPVYCAIVQIWIHVEAFWLFMKGVEFIPHPKGSETAASRIIAKMMVPFFAAKDWLDRKRSSRSSCAGSSVHDKMD